MLNMDSRKWSRLRIQRCSNPVPIWIKKKEEDENHGGGLLPLGRRKLLVLDSPLLVIAL